MADIWELYDLFVEDVIVLVASFALQLLCVM